MKDGVLNKLLQVCAASRRLGHKPPERIHRYMNAVMKLASWEKKIKLAQTKLRKYKRRVRYYKKATGI